MHQSVPVPRPILDGSQIRAGLLAVVPLWPGVIPFGMIYAVSALAAGLTPLQTLGMSMIVFAGSAQFTAAGMIAVGAGPVALILTTLIINARHMLMGASLAPYVRQTPGWLRMWLAAQLTDETYALGIKRFVEGTGSVSFQIGANLCLYLIWQASTLAGILVGARIPDPAAYGLDLVFPLTFIGLLVPLLRTRIHGIVATCAALIGLIGLVLLPGKWYLLLAGILASGLGAWMEGHKS